MHVIHVPSSTLSGKDAGLTTAAQWAVDAIPPSRTWLARNAGGVQKWGTGSAGVRIEVIQHNLPRGVVNTVTWEFNIEEVQKFDLERAVRNLSEGLRENKTEEFNWEQFAAKPPVEN